MLRKILMCGRKRNRFHHSTGIIYPLLIFFKAIGLLTLCIRLDLNREKNIIFGSSYFGIMYNIMIYVLYSGLRMVIIVKRISFNYPGKSTLIDNIVVHQVILSVIVVSAVLLAFCFNQKAMAKIGNGLMEVHKKLDMIEFLPYRNSILRRSVAIGVVNFFMFILQCTFSYLRLRKSGDWTSIYVRINWFAESLGSVLICTSVIQYFLIVIFIDAKFVEINRLIKRVSKSFKMIFRNSKQRTTASSSTISCIIFLNDMYIRLLKISNIVNDCFSAAILFITVFIFYNLTTNVFYAIVIVTFSSERNYISLANLIINIICISLPISLLAFAVTKLRKETGETARIVHNLLKYTNDPELTSELSLFSLQLLHEKPKFTACGFFDLDCSLLQGIIGAVTTYMVILIQFQVTTTQQ